MGQCLKICEETFCLKMVDAISGQIFLILMLDQFSQRRKMRLEQAHLIKFIAKFYELFNTFSYVLQISSKFLCINVNKFDFRPRTQQF